MTHPLDSIPHLVAAFYRQADRTPERVMMSQAIAGPAGAKHPRPRIARTFREVRARVNSIAAFLRESGVKPGDRVAILSNSRIEWVEADLAVLAAGAVVVTVYQSLRAPEIGYLLYDSGATVVFAENQDQVAKLRSIATTPFDIAATEERAACRVTVSLNKIIAFEEVTAEADVVQFEAIASKQAADVVAGLDTVTRDSVATLVYTSGTTGPPKGVVQTNGNHLSNVRQAYQTGVFESDSTMMLFLPLAHSFAKLMSYLSATMGVELRFPAVIDQKSSRLDQDSITRDIAEANAQIIPLVPRLLEKMKSVLERRAAGRNAVGRLLGLTFWCAAAVYTARKEGRNPPLGARIGHATLGFMRAVVRRRLFGSCFERAVSGGAKLSPDINHFFESLGIVVLQGYGLTETCVATNLNRPDDNRIGTVGPVLTPDVELLIAADGEICYRGPNIAKGYWKRDAATAASWDREGWFHTGDIGSVDADGFLSITGRKKELIVTAGGKKIAPDRIEGLIKSIDIVSQAVLVGEGKPYCCALVTLDPAAVKDWAAANKVTLSGKFSEEESVKKLLEDQVKVINKELASYESVKRVAIVDDEFTVDNGLMTPTLKVRRNEVVKRFAGMIEGMYSSGKGSGE